MELEIEYCSLADRNLEQNNRAACRQTTDPFAFQFNFSVWEFYWLKEQTTTTMLNKEQQHFEGSESSE